MVQKIVRGMRQHGKAIVVVVALLAIGLVLVLSMKTARANFGNNDYTTVATAPCACPGSCSSPCQGPWLFPEGVSPEGHVSVYFSFGYEKTMNGTLPLGGTWFSALSGGTDLGNGFVPTWLRTATKIIVNQQNPNAANGHSYDIRNPDGTIRNHNWNSAAYDAQACGDTEVLTLDGSGNPVLTGKDGGEWAFASNGMPATHTDRNGNVTTYSTSGYQVTGIDTDRSKSVSTTHNGSGYMATLSDPWSFSYDGSGNLTTIVSPTTADQTSGITTTLSYDGSNRLTGVQDGRGNSTTYAYVGSTRQVSSVSVNGHTSSFSYGSGYTERTDGNGNVHRWYYSGNQVTKTCLRISGADAFATEYRYSGNVLSNIKYPRGNRVDFTFDGMYNLTEKRRRTADTGTNDSSDIVESWAYTNNFATSYTDPLGNVTTYTRDGAGNATAIGFPTVTHPATQSSVTKSFTYNGRGQVTQETDEEGKVVTHTYFSNSSNPEYGLLEKTEVDPSGLDLTTAYTYDAGGNVATVTDPNGGVTTHAWDNLRRRTSVTGPITNYETDFHYDASGNLTEKAVHNVDKDGTVVSANPWWTTTYTYTAENQLSVLTEEIDTATGSRATTYFYDSNGNRTRVIKPEGNEDRWTYDARDQVATHVRGYGASGAATEEFVYDDNGNLTVHEDARDNDTTYTYDLFDRRTKTTNALGHYEETDFDKAGNVVEIRRYDSTPSPDVLLQRSSRSFDERNRHWQTSDLRDDPTSTTFSDAVTTTERFKTGVVKKVTNARSKDTTYAFDNAWRVALTTDAMGNEFANEYDDNGNRIAWSIEEVDGGSTVTHEYEADHDASNRMIEKRAVDRTNGSNVLETTYAYDSHGNMCFTVNAEGNPTRFTFDGLMRMTKREVALTLGSTINDFSTAIVTQWGFDKNDRLVSFKDDATNESTWVYDALDRQTTMTYPTTSPAQTVAYAYDANDNVTGLTDPAGNVIADTFDLLNRNTARSVTLQTGWLDTTSETRTFDALNRMTLNQDDDYKVEYTHAVNGLSSVAYEERQSYATGSAYTKTVTKTFNELGSKATKAYPNGLSLTYSYNDIDAYSSISDGTNTIASWTYVGQRPKVLTFQNGTTATTAYTGFRGEIAMIKHETSTPTTILELDYGYNKVHDRTFERYGASGSAGDAFAYDKAQRLATAWIGSTTPSDPTASGVTYTKKIDYNMDDDGNRTSVVVTPYGQSAQTTSYTTNNLNQYTAVGSASPTHDANGNQTDNGTFKFKYSYKNLIAEVRLSSNNNLVATYKYDANGRRVEKAVSGGITERYVYSALETIETYNGSNAWKQSFVFGQGIDSVLMLEQADVLDFDSDSNLTETTRSFYHRNALGSVMDITDMSQAKVESYRYTPHGEPAISRNGTPQAIDPLGQHWSFVSHHWDEETQLGHNRWRTLVPATGRFMQRDPLLYRQSACLYGYAGESPTGRLDPLGLEWTPSPAIHHSGYAVFSCVWRWKNGRYEFCPRGNNWCKFLVVHAEWDSTEWTDTSTDDVATRTWERHWLRDVADVMASVDRVIAKPLPAFVAGGAFGKAMEKAADKAKFLRYGGYVAAAWEVMEYVASVASDKLVIVTSSQTTTITKRTYSNFTVTDQQSHQGPCDGENAQHVTGQCTIDENGEPQMPDNGGSGETNDGNPPGFKPTR